MSWHDEMCKAALAIAAPGLVLAADDEIHMDQDYSEGYAYSSVTFEPAYFTIEVSVWRPTDRTLTQRGPDNELVFYSMVTGKHYYRVFSRTYSGDDAHQFMVTLMRSA